MDAVRLTNLVPRRWWPAIATAVLGALAGLLYGLIAPQTYTATAYVLVVATNPANDTSAVNYAQVYARLGRQSEVVGRAADASRGTATVDELRRSVRTSASPDAPVIEVTGSAGTAQRAAILTNLVADGLVSNGDLQTGETRMNLVRLSPAYPPPAPSAPKPFLSLLIGAVVGFLVGALFVLTRPDRGRTVETDTDPFGTVYRPVNPVLTDLP